MVRILGNSPERLRIIDLGDVIYYKQRKDYTDQEFESSKDLQREVRRGNLTILERFATPKGSSELGGNGSVIVHQTVPAISIEDVKQAVREVLPQEQGESLKNLIPSLIDTLRQELSSLIGSGNLGQIKTYDGPEYVPEIDTSEMISNVQVEEKKVSGDEMASNLEALRKLSKGNK